MAAGVGGAQGQHLHKQHHGHVSDFLPSIHGDKIPTARIAAIEFGIFDAQETQRMSHVHVVNRNLYDLNQRRDPMRNGCLDRRLGTSDKQARCATCNNTLADCTGHFGHIKLRLPVYHIGFFKKVVKVLQCICKRCSRVLLDASTRRQQAERFALPLGRPELARRGAKILEMCKKTRLCPYCGAANGSVKKMAGVYRLVHDVRTGSAAATQSAAVRSAALQKELGGFEEALARSDGGRFKLRDYIERLQEDITALDVLRLFRAITDADCRLLGFNAERARPEDMLITHLPVPPVCIRPSVLMGPSGTNEDDLTVQLGDIIYVNNFIDDAFAKGAHTPTIMENWEFLQQQVARYINSDLPGFPKSIVGTPIRALTQRLKGKAGRFRGNLSGKRVNYTSRTVVSPDPNLRIDEVGVPLYVAMTLTYPEKVTVHNICRLREAVRNGQKIYPGANILDKGGGRKHFLGFGDRDYFASLVRIGMTVERHLVDGDLVLFNRQPSLHKMSIMCHRVRVMRWRTFRFNECVCTPYNADFDGDEMNLHVPQTEEARVEAGELMSVKQNLVTPRHGVPLVVPLQDFVTTSYLLSQRDMFFDQARASQICSYFTDPNERIRLPRPAIFKPVALWTGKQVLSLLISPRNPSGSKTWRPLNINFSNRAYTQGGVMCERDGYVVVRNGSLLAGTLDKTAIGGTKQGILYALIRDNSPDLAAAVMNRLAKLSARWIGQRGFSIGLADVTPSSHLLSIKKKLVKTGYQTCRDNIAALERGDLDPIPGCNAEETLESLNLGLLSRIREDAGQACLQEMDYHDNAPLVMALCGSKGSKINISQMTACVGQQAVQGSRIQNGFVNRTLPHFPLHSRDAAAKGFVENSFRSGLTATEFFFHTMAGREGLVDTAVKTAETGYMQRRLVKALEDLCLHYDGTVRTSEKYVVQFTYGDDGLDPVYTGAGVFPVDFEHVLLDVRSRPHCQELGCGVGSKSRMSDEGGDVTCDEISKEAVSLRSMKGKSRYSYMFLDTLADFLDNLAKKISEATSILGCTVDGSEGSCKKKKNRGRRTKASENDIYERVLSQMYGLSRARLKLFIKTCLHRYTRACVEPGTTVGAIAAQSIGEPGTQMTLTTFHFAGVASMNITLGVPRIKEIINASKNIRSPIIVVPLLNNTDVDAARIVRSRMERTELAEVCRDIRAIMSGQECYLSVRLDFDIILRLQLDLTPDRVRSILLSDKALKVKNAMAIEVMSGTDTAFVVPDDSGDVMTTEDVAEAGEIRIYPSYCAGDSGTCDMLLLAELERLKSVLPRVLVCGVSSVSRAVINEKGEGRYELLVEGKDLRRTMTVEGVRAEECRSNHIVEVASVLGIEAARGTIINEIETTMSGHGLAVDKRHLGILADVMTFRGEVLGITRFGVAKMKESVLMQASFEKTADHLFEAAYHGLSDGISGVSECIIMGLPIPVGTGVFEVRQDTSKVVLAVQTLNGGDMAAAGRASTECGSMDAEFGPVHGDDADATARAYMVDPVVPLMYDFDYLMDGEGSGAR